MSNHNSNRPGVAHTIRRLAVPILLFWVALAAVPNILVPQLEEVGRLHNVGLSSP
jgi:putative drug exporter of the RND superfamily